MKRFLLDVHALALFRIALGLILLCDLGVRFSDLEAHYTDAGIFPRSALELSEEVPPDPPAGLLSLSLHTYTGNANGIRFLFALQALAAGLFLVGWRTRWATFIVWFLLMSLQSRNPMILNSSDHLLRLLLFFGFFLPLGSIWSLDARQGRGGERPSPAASLALLLQVCMLYGFTVLLKSDPAWRSDFTAGLLAVQADLYVTPLGAALEPFRRFLHASTLVVYLLEALVPVLLVLLFPFRKTRFTCLLLLAIMHLGMGLCFELGLWPWVSAAALLPFLPFQGLEAPSETTSMDWTGATASVFLALVFWLNLTTLPSFAVGMPNAVQTVTRFFGLGQEWDMFAPYPMTDDGWFVLLSTPETGPAVNLLHPDLATDDSKPELYSQHFSNHRWRKYFIRLRRASADSYLGYLGDWMLLHPGYFKASPASESSSIELILYQEITEWNGVERPPEAFSLLFQESSGLK